MTRVQPEPPLRDIADALPVLISYVDSARHYRFVNRAYTEWFGQEPGAIEGRHMRDVVGEVAYADLEPHIEAVLAGETVRFESRVSYKDGGPRHIEASYIPRCGEGGRIEGFYVMVADASDRKAAEAALRHSERRYRQIFDGANDYIFTADTEQRLTDANPACALAMGMHRDELIGRSIRDFVSAEGWEQTTRMLRQKLEHGGTTRHDIEVFAPDGRRMYWEINSSLAYDIAGNVVGLHAIARDVTERHESEERQRLLVNELNHRVKNTLALVQGLAVQSLAEGRDMKEARGVFEQRLSALARAHDLLTRESWSGATLSELVDASTGHFNQPPGRIESRGKVLRLEPKAAVSLSLALHELATNAAKYGALSSPGGRVVIEWQTGARNRLLIEWTEHDGPAVDPPARRGFGLKMVERVLGADLGGSAAIEFRTEGLRCLIEAPLEQAVSASPP